MINCFRPSTAFPTVSDKAGRGLGTRLPFLCTWCTSIIGLKVMLLILISEVKKVEIDMEGQKVSVQSSLSGDELLATLKKTGRECSYVGLKQF